MVSVISGLASLLFSCYCLKVLLVLSKRTPYDMEGIRIPLCTIGPEQEHLCIRYMTCT